MLQIIKVFEYNNIYYAVRCLYTWHMYTANCLLLHFMLSYYQVMFWPAGLHFEQIYFMEISRRWWKVYFVVHFASRPGFTLTPGHPTTAVSTILISWKHSFLPVHKDLEQVLYLIMNVMLQQWWRSECRQPEYMSSDCSSHYSLLTFACSLINCCNNCTCTMLLMVLCTVAIIPWELTSHLV